MEKAQHPQVRAQTHCQVHGQVQGEGQTLPHPQCGSVEELAVLAASDRLVKIFCDLIKHDTRSDPESTAVPSTPGQLELGRLLLRDVQALGFEAKQDAHGVVMVKVPASLGCESLPGLCLLTHLDTAPDASGAGVRAALVKNYAGGVIELAGGLTLDPQVLGQALIDLKGEDLIVTDGTTLLGADDKAGVAVLLHLLEEIAADSAFPRPPLTVVFSVDEELGRSGSYLDLQEINCACGVTVDGGALGELDTATFNAAEAQVLIHGRSVHTGTAYKIMVNAVNVAAEFISLLPASERPETTRDLEGFYHVYTLQGAVEQASLRLIVRDFEEEGLQRRLQQVQDTAAFINHRLGFASVSVSVRPQYLNMAAVLKEHPRIVRLCRLAYEKAGVPLRECAVRGGTDGSMLSAAGLPCPNIFTGGLFCHGPSECLCLSAFRKSASVVRSLVQEAALPEGQE